MPVTTYNIVDGELLSENRNGTERQYVPDAQGNTIALLDTSGAIAKSYSYWSYGSVESGDTAATKYLHGGTYGVRRQSNGDSYARFRIEDLMNGRWLTVDAVWPDERPYLYCVNNPATFIDIYGRSPFQSSHSIVRSPAKEPKCYVKVCSMYGNADDNEFVWDPWIVTHQYVCVKSPSGRECKYGLGANDSNSPCQDTDKLGFPVRCKSVTTDCKVALAACLCIDKIRKNPPPYRIPTSVCWHTKEYVRDCVEEVLGKPFHNPVCTGKGWCRPGAHLPGRW